MAAYIKEMTTFTIAEASWNLNLIGRFENGALTFAVIDTEANTIDIFDDYASAKNLFLKLAKLDVYIQKG